MFWLRLSGWLFLALLVATAALTVIGSRLPATHTTTASRTIPATPAQLWPLLTDPESQPRWRTGISATSPLPDQATLPCWTEFRAHLAIPVCITTSNTPRTLTFSTTDPRLPFSIARTVTLSAATPTSTIVTLTETVTTTQPIVRFRERYLDLYKSAPDVELANLAQAVAQR